MKEERIAQVGYINEEMQHALISIYGAALLNPSVANKSVQVAMSIKGATALRDRLDEFLSEHYSSPGIQ
jgi:hypothetical protein